MTANNGIFPEAEQSASGILTKKRAVFAIKCQKSLAFCANWIYNTHRNLTEKIIVQY